MTTKQAMLCLAVVVPLLVLVWVLGLRLDRPPAETPRSDYEGKGGQAMVDFILIDVPDLQRTPATTASRADAQACQGRSWRDAVALLGEPTSVVPTWSGGAIALWASAVPAADDDPQTWPVAHVVAITDLPPQQAKAMITRVAAVSSLGRVLGGMGSGAQQPPGAP